MNSEIVLFTMGKHLAAKYVDLKDLLVTQILMNKSGRDPRFLEVGVLFGGYAIHVLLSSPNSTVVGIDPFPGSEGPEIRNLMIGNLEQFGLQSRFRVFDTWDELEGSPERGPFTVIHIDGEHSETGTLNDLRAAANAISPDGVIVVDDWHHPMFPGVGSAMHQFMAEGDFRMFAITDRKAYLCRSEFHQELQGA